MPTPIEVLILLKLADQASKEAEAAADKIAAKYKDLGQKMQKVGTVMSAAITAPFVLFAKSAVEGASDTEESLNKVRVVFDETAGEIEDFAKDSAKNLGLSQQAALEAAGSFGNLFDSLGLARPEATKMSKEVLTLAADLASFNNIDPTEALEKLQSGLVGQAKPLRELGVNISEAAVQAKALQLGLGGVGRELTEAEKVTARYALIVEQTKNAQGDFARTSDGLANSQRIAKAEMDDLAAEMGKALLPIMAEGTKILKGLIEGFMKLSPEVRTGILVVVGLVAVIGPLLVVFGTILTILPALATAFAVLTGPIGLIILAVGLLAAAWATNFGDIQGKTKAVVDFLTPLFEGFRVMVLFTFKGIVTGVVGFVNGIIGIINGFIEKYDALAERLHLPLIGKLELIVPDLSAVDAAINQIARDREARIFVNSYPGSQNAYPGQGMYAEGTPYVPYTGLALVHQGERIITAEENSSGSWGGGGVTVTGNTFYVREESDIERIAEALDELARREQRRRGITGMAA